MSLSQCLQATGNSLRDLLDAAIELCTPDMGSQSTIGPAFPGGEYQSYAPWTERGAPQRLLIIRLHAIGDVAATFPASAALRERFPSAQIDFATTPPAAPLVQSVRLFDRVVEIPSYRRTAAWLAGLAGEIHDLRRMRYDVILDLQRNWISRMVRRLAFPHAWGEFDRFAPRTAADRTLEVFHRTGFEGLTPVYAVAVPDSAKAFAENLLVQHGWDGSSRLVVLNPAGLWPTRHWPSEHYAALAELWTCKEAVQFVLLGTERIRERASLLQNRLRGAIVNLVGATALHDVLAVLQRVSLVVTEDSGLMHMAWASGVPVVALFGSSRHVWSAPPGDHVRVLHSGDLSCGQCMSPRCAYDDVHCLTRFSPGRVFALAQGLISADNRIGELS